MTGNVRRPGQIGGPVGGEPAKRIIKGRNPWRRASAHLRNTCAMIENARGDGSLTEARAFDVQINDPEEVLHRHGYSIGTYTAACQGVMYRFLILLGYGIFTV